MNVNKVHILKVTKVDVYPTISVTRREYMDLRLFLNEKFKLDLKDTNIINYDLQEFISYRSTNKSIYLFPIKQSNVGPYKIIAEYYIYSPLFAKTNTCGLFSTFGDIIEPMIDSNLIPNNILDIKLEPNINCIKYRDFVFYIQYENYKDLYNVLSLPDIVSLIHNKIYTIEDLKNKDTSKFISSNGYYIISPCSIL